MTATMALRTEPTFDRPDDVYATILAAHDGLSEEDSRRLNARLILLLANHIGDATVLAEALDAAKQTL